MAITDRPELSATEKRMPLAEYYDLPLYPPGPRCGPRSLRSVE